MEVYNLRGGKNILNVGEAQIFAAQNVFFSVFLWLKQLSAKRVLGYWLITSTYSSNPQKIQHAGWPWAACCLVTNAEHASQGKTVIIQMPCETKTWTKCKLAINRHSCLLAAVKYSVCCRTTLCTLLLSVSRTSQLWRKILHLLRIHKNVIENAPL